MGVRIQRCPEYLSRALWRGDLIEVLMEITGNTRGQGALHSSADGVVQISSLVPGGAPAPELRPQPGAGGVPVRPQELQEHVDSSVRHICRHSLLSRGLWSVRSRGRKLGMKWQL